MKILTIATAPRLSAALWAGLLLAAAPALADCLTDADPIATDRPTAPNSSGTVPQGSVQLENGAGVAHGGGVTTLDLPETRARFGVFACTEFLVDLPDYTHASQHGVDGTTDMAPAIKHQFDGLPDGLTLWGTLGVALPTGDKTISGRGPAPFLQLPASYDLSDGWVLAGMVSSSLRPRDTNREPLTQSSLYLDRTLSDSVDIFVEYNDVYQRGAPTQNSVDIGGSYRYESLRQIDMKIGIGLNRAAPDWYFTIGYSLRFDHMF